MITYMFPGQGSQFKGMGKTLFDEFPELTKIADEILGYSIKALCLNDEKRQLNQTAYTQPALYVVNALSYKKKLEDTGTTPDFLVGHSLGEYNALQAAGAMNFESGLKLVKKRGALMSEAPKGAMAAILNLAAEEIKQILQSNELTAIDIANFNAPLQTIISGLEEDISMAQAIFEKENAKYVRLNTSGAFHSRYLEPSKIKYTQYLNKFKLSALQIPVISNVHARPYQDNEIVKNLSDQITHSVRWSESMTYLMEQGDMRFEEMGVGDVLTKLIVYIKEQAPVITPKQSETPQQTKTKAVPTNKAVVTQKEELSKVPNSLVETETKSMTNGNRGKVLEDLHIKINDWNKKYPIGTKVSVETYDEDLQTRTEAIILFGHRAAVYMNGYKGYFSLDEVTPVSSV